MGIQSDGKEKYVHEFHRRTFHAKIWPKGDDSIKISFTGIIGIETELITAAEQEPSKPIDDNQKIVACWNKGNSNHAVYVTSFEKDSQGHCLFKYLDSHGKSKTPGPEALKSAEDIYEICFVSIENFDSGTISNDVEKLRKKEQSGEDNLLQKNFEQLKTNVEEKIDSVLKQSADVQDKVNNSENKEIITSERLMQLEERLTWTEKHELAVNDQSRQEILEKLGDNLETLGDSLEICYSKTHIKDAKFQDWFINDEEKRYCIEFCENNGSYLVTIKDFTRYIHEIQVVDTFEKDDNVVARIRQVLGSTNHSFMLRNSEHIAQYIYTGVWGSFQVFQDSELRKKFKLAEAAKELMHELPTELDKAIKSKKIYEQVKENTVITDFNCSLKDESHVYNVLVVGEVGAGKRTVVCHLFNKTICDTTGRARTFVEIFTGRYIFGKDFPDGEESPSPVKIFSTIGTCKKTLKEKELQDIVSSVSSDLIRKIPNKILVVFSAETNSERNHPMKPILMDILKYKERKDRFLFIMTKCESGQAEEMQKIFDAKVKLMTDDDLPKVNNQLMLSRDMEIPEKLPSPYWSKTHDEQLEDLRGKVFMSSEYSRSSSRFSISSNH